jgi:hypothetical protein
LCLSPLVGLNFLQYKNDGMLSTYKSDFGLWLV